MTQEMTTVDPKLIQRYLGELTSTCVLQLPSCRGLRVLLWILAHSETDLLSVNGNLVVIKSSLQPMVDTRLEGCAGVNEDAFEEVFEELAEQGFFEMLSSYETYQLVWPNVVASRM